MDSAIYFNKIYNVHVGLGLEPERKVETLMIPSEVIPVYRTLPFHILLIDETSHFGREQLYRG